MAQNSLLVVILHHTASDTSAKQLNLQSIQQGKFGAPFDIIIDKTGMIALMPQWIKAEKADHMILNTTIRQAFSYTDHLPAQDVDNSVPRPIQIALIGDFNSNKPTVFQQHILTSMLSYVRSLYVVDYIYYHNDVSLTTCPGKNFFSKSVLGIDPISLNIYGKSI